jgi:anti-sigma-K factor RskA
MTHEDVQALASEYVLGSLDEVTRARVTAHLSSCGACADEIREVAQAMDAMGRSVPEAEPTASLRERITAIPARVPQLPVAARVTAPVTRRSSRQVSWFATVAASLVAVVATWQAFGARAEVQRLRRELADLELKVGDSLVARASLQKQVDEFAKLAEVLRSSDLVSYSLAGSGTAANAHARAYVTAKNGMVFTAEGLPALAPGRTYQLWVIGASGPVSVGLFAPDANGRVQAVMVTPDIGAMPAAVAVSLEPAGGSPQPSTTPIMAGTPSTQQ